MDAFYGKTLLKWMIWGYHHFRKHIIYSPLNIQQTNQGVGVFLTAQIESMRASARWLGLPQPRIPLAPVSTNQWVTWWVSCDYHHPNGLQSISKRKKHQQHFAKKKCWILESSTVYVWFLFEIESTFKQLNAHKKAQGEKRRTIHWYCWWFRNPAFTRISVGSLSHHLRRVLAPSFRWVGSLGISEPSTVSRHHDVVDPFPSSGLPPGSTRPAPVLHRFDPSFSRGCLRYLEP